jgi:uncharacterized DUF497 family protein
MNKFEWDENKRALNLEKHGIDFVDAIDVFMDLSRIEAESSRDNELRYQKLRYQTIGAVNDVVILVVYTYRAGTVRLISARRASKNEREAYTS